VILDQIPAFGMPGGVAVAAHVDRDHVITRREMRRQVIEGAGDAIEAVNHDERRLVRIAPVHVVDAQTVDRDEAVGGLGCHRRRQ
jgi:hypothetical protein